MGNEMIAAIEHLKKVKFAMDNWTVHTPFSYKYLRAQYFRAINKVYEVEFKARLL